MFLKENTVSIKINSVKYDYSVVDGPGLRSVLFLQGCEKSCPCCHNNMETLDIDGGQEYSVSDLASDIIQSAGIKRLTISGGEPLLQAGAVLKLVKELQGFDLCLYTGYELEEIENSKEYSKILPYLTYLKVGSYDESKRTTTKKFVGSSNQVFYKVKNGEICEEA